MSLPVTLSLRSSCWTAKYRAAPVTRTKAALVTQTDRLKGRVKMFVMKESGGSRNMKAFLQEYLLNFTAIIYAPLLPTANYILTSSYVKFIHVKG
jgi:hypothetical protein